MVNLPFQLVNDVRNSSLHPGESPKRLQGDAFALPSSQQDAQLLDQQHFLGHILLQIHVFIPATTWSKKRVISSCNMVIYGSLNLQSFPKGGKGGTWLLCADWQEHMHVSQHHIKLPDRAQSRASSWKCRLLWRREKQRTTASVSFAKVFQISQIGLVGQGSDTCLQNKGNIIGSRELTGLQS